SLLAIPFVKKISLSFNMLCSRRPALAENVVTRNNARPFQLFHPRTVTQGLPMWFRNLLLYRFSQDVPFTEAELLAALEERPARPCASQETHTLGWTTPFGRHSENLLQVGDGYWLIALRKEERILPGSVVKDALAEKVEEIEARDARKIYKKERDTLKDDI